MRIWWVKKENFRVSDTANMGVIMRRETFRDVNALAD